MHDRHRAEELHGAAGLRPQLYAGGLGVTGFVENPPFAGRDLVGPDHHRMRCRCRDRNGLGERQPLGPLARFFAREEPLIDLGPLDRKGQAQPLQQLPAVN